MGWRAERAITKRIGTAGAAAGGFNTMAHARTFGNAEVPEPAHGPAVGVRTVEEDVGRLDVPVQDLSVMDVLDGSADLEEPGPNDVLGKELLGLFHDLDLVGEVLGAAELLNDAQHVGRGEVVSEPDDVGVVEHAEQLRLLHEVCNFFALHPGEVDLFDHERLLVGRRVVRAQVHGAVRALANHLALPVLVGNRPQRLDRRHPCSAGAVDEQRVRPVCVCALG